MPWPPWHGAARGGAPAHLQECSYNKLAFCFITHVGRAVFLESRAPLVAPARETRHCPHRDSDRCVKSKHATVDSRNRHPRFVNHVCITCAVRTSCFRHVPRSALDVEHPRVCWYTSREPFRDACSAESIRPPRACSTAECDTAGHAARVVLD